MHRSEMGNTPYVPHCCRCCTAVNGTCLAYVTVFVRPTAFRLIALAALLSATYGSSTPSLGGTAPIPVACDGALSAADDGTSRPRIHAD